MFALDAFGITTINDLKIFAGFFDAILRAACVLLAFSPPPIAC
jgi:hypothetical protein